MRLTRASLKNHQSPAIGLTSGLTKFSGLTGQDYFNRFMQSRRAENLTPKSLRYYTQTVGRFLKSANPDVATPEVIGSYLIQFKNGGGRHAHWRALRAFFSWREDMFNLLNPMIKMKPPKVAKQILPTLRLPEIKRLIDEAETVRDQALIALLTESGMRLSEIVNVKPTDVDWHERNIRVIGKGRKERNVPFGKLSEYYLCQWLNENQLESGSTNIWNLNTWGIVSMLRRLEKRTGLSCNPHVFRRSFATIQKILGTDISIIKELGGWESLTMVERYTRAFTYQEARKHYKDPLGELVRA